jgi:hypothetical protein
MKNEYIQIRIISYNELLNIVQYFQPKIKFKKKFL